MSSTSVLRTRPLTYANKVLLDSLDFEDDLEKLRTRDTSKAATDLKLCIEIILRMFSILGLRRTQLTPVRNQWDPLGLLKSEMMWGFITGNRIPCAWHCVWECIEYFKIYFIEEYLPLCELTKMVFLHLKIVSKWRIYTSMRVFLKFVSASWL